MARRYGDVFSFYIGDRLVVVLHGYKAIYEALIDNKDVFAGRPKLYAAGLLGHDKGIVMVDGDLWTQQRRFTLRTFRNLGTGKARIEEVILNECSVLLKRFRETRGTPADPFQLIAPAVFNVISTVVFGKRFPRHDSPIQDYIQTVNYVFKVTGFSALVNYIPFLRYIPGDPFHLVTAIKRYKMEVLSYLEHQMEEHRQTFSSNNIRDVIDAYLQELQQDNAETRYFTEIQAKIAMADMVNAGYETVATSLTWALLYMVMYPEFQASVQREIDDVIGRERPPRMTDRQKMPHTDACIHETLRYCNTVPLTVPHATLENIEFKGYTLPKGAIIWPHLPSAHGDKDYFDRPEQFDPTRFLSDSGHFKMLEGYMPFGIGPRKCAGESLARMELFLVFSSLLQTFSFSLPDGACRPDLKGVLGITLAPKPFTLCAHERP